MPESLPPCGVYRTTRPVGDLPAGRLVYFHNHGDPGPGLYRPRRWVLNRAEFESQGMTLPTPVEQYVSSLQALPSEGFYRVTQRFYCCAKQCASFEPELLVQLGYNGEGQAIVFLPEMTAAGIAIPESGTLVDNDRLDRLKALKLTLRPDPGVQSSHQLH